VVTRPVLRTAADRSHYLSGNSLPLVSTIDPPLTSPNASLGLSSGICDCVQCLSRLCPREQWRDGEFDLNDYLIESMQVGIIETVDEDA
jgi:hypothetical protein